MESRVVFADSKLKEAFAKLKDTRSEDKNFYMWLNRAFDDRYHQILYSVDWDHFKDVHLKFNDVTGLLTIANELSYGASIALYHATSKQRLEESKKHIV